MAKASEILVGDDKKKRRPSDVIQEGHGLPARELAPANAAYQMYLVDGGKKSFAEWARTEYKK